MTVPLLRVDDLHVYCPDHAVGTAVHGLQLTVCHGELHAITGTERSVMSALGAILMGSDRYEVARGTIEFRGDDVTDWPVDDLAKAGMFLAFDDPQEIPGVSMIQVLHEALSARSGSDVSISELRVATTEWMQRLDMNPDHLDRQGYEILHMAMLRPGLAIVDATDPDLDDDALRSIARGIGEVRSDQPDMGIVVVTEHRRLLDDLDPDVVHVLVDGRIVTSGNIDLAGGIGLVSFDQAAINEQFPILRREIDGKPLVYLDSGNTSQKPRCVIDAMSSFMENTYAPINRSSYRLAGEATDAYEQGRIAIARLINAPSADEIVFTKNATESMNLIAMAWGRANLVEGDVVVLTEMEHHANIVPWQMLVQERGIRIRWIPLTADGQLDLTDIDTILDGAKVLSFTAMSNVLGTITPIAHLCDKAHTAGALAVVDACQFVPHNVTDVQSWNADLVAFSSHKMCGPSGIGMLWGRMEILDSMPPFLGGGNMIDNVTFDGFTTAPVPAKFEAGTPPIVEAVGLAAAVEFLESVGMANIRQHEMDLSRYTLDTLNARFGDDITIYGPDNVEQRGGVFSFAFRDLHPHDVSQVLDERNVCVRAGHHCAKPLMKSLGVNATTRASIYLYNTTDDIDALADGLDGATDIFGL